MLYFTGSSRRPANKEKVELRPEGRQSRDSRLSGGTCVPCEERVSVKALRMTLVSNIQDSEGSQSVKGNEQEGDS